MAGFGMRFTVDPGSSEDLAQIVQIAEELKKDLPEGHPGPNRIKTVARRVMAAAKMAPIEEDGKRS